MSQWFESFDESFWLPPAEGAEEEAAFIRKALGLRRGQRVLDCPCGDGRIAVYLAGAGLRVMGVDLKAAFVRRAWARFGRAGLKGDFQAADMRQINFDSEFDGLCNWRGSFGYFSEVENRQVLTAFARALRPGGRLLIDQPNREALLRHFESIRHGRVTIRSRWDGRRQRVYSVWTARRAGRRVSSRLSIRLYTLGQFKRFFRRVGLELQAVYGDHHGGPYGRSSRRLIVVGVKV